MQSPSSVSSARRSSNWLIVAAGLAGYIGLVVLVPGDRMQPASPFPWWIAQAVPPIFYGALALFCGRGLSARRWLVLTLSLWAVHLTLGFVTELVVGPSPLFPPPPVPAILWVPLLLFPLRDVFRGAPTARGAHHRPASLRIAPAPSVRPETVRPVNPTAPVSAPRESSSAPRETVAASMEAVTKQQPARPAPKAAPTETPLSKPAAPRASEAERPPASPASADTSGSDTSGEMVRVSFNRIAEQLPLNSFKLTPDRIAGSLREPGSLLVPQSLVRAQLLEGVVRVRWDVVSDQFPRQPGLTDAEIAGRLSDGQLVLPLDELVAQLPRGLFALTNLPLDLTGIEEFPEPFQALSADQSDEGAVEGETAAAGAAPPAVETAGPAEVEAAPAEAPFPEHDPEIEAETPGRYELTDLDLEPSVEAVPAAASFAGHDSEIDAESGGRYELTDLDLEPPVEAVPAAASFAGHDSEIDAESTGRYERTDLDLEPSVEAVPAAASFAGHDSEIDAESAGRYELTDLDLEPSVGAVPSTAPLAQRDPQVEIEFSARNELTDVDLDPRAEAALTARIESEPSPAPALDIESTALEADQPVDDDAEWLAISFLTPAVDGPAAGPLVAPVEEAPHTDGRSGFEIISLLAPVGLLHLAVDSADHLSLVVVSAPGLPPPERLTSAARLMLPFFAHFPAWERTELLTVRGPDLALVLAPLDSPDGVLVAAAPPTRSLAMLEILCRRAALGHGGDTGSATGDDGSRDEPDLVEIELSTRIHAIAQSLSAVGPVIASTLRDLETEWPVYCFLPPESDVRATAAFACEVSRAMSAAGDEAGTLLHTAVFASGRCRMIIRVSTNPYRGGIVVASGQTDRPGLAYRQAASAANTLLVG